jgi:hypothetical protein
MAVRKKTLLVRQFFLLRPLVFFQIDTSPLFAVSNG